MAPACLDCGEAWATDPRLAVACPDCRAAVGIGCVRPSGHRGRFVEPHKAREQVAVNAGLMSICPTPSGLPATVKRVDLFGNVTDTYATEGELNGWREQQSALVGRQGGLL